MLSEWELRTCGGFPALGAFSRGGWCEITSGVALCKVLSNGKTWWLSFPTPATCLRPGWPGKTPQRKCLDRDRLPGSLGWFATLLYFSDKVWLNHILTKLGLTWAVTMTSFRLWACPHTDLVHTLKRILAVPRSRNNWFWSWAIKLTLKSYENNY